MAEQKIDVQEWLPLDVKSVEPDVILRGEGDD